MEEKVGAEEAAEGAECDDMVEAGMEREGDKDGKGEGKMGQGMDVDDPRTEKLTPTVKREWE